MQSRTLKRLLFILMPSAALPLLAALSFMGNPVWDELTRATIALVVLMYLFGVVATIWALQPFMQEADFSPRSDISPK